MEVVELLKLELLMLLVADQNEAVLLEIEPVMLVAVVLIELEMLYVVVQVNSRYGWWLLLEFKVVVLFEMAVVVLLEML